jgi:type I site-specific restriction-modification system R (restriction) subunit
MPYKDPKKRKEKHKEYSAKYYEANKESSKKRISDRKKERRKEWSAFKSTLKCAKCGEDHPATFDFHHVERHPDNKKVSKLLQSHNYGAARKEIKKCIVLCANCHRKVHYEEDLIKKARQSGQPNHCSDSSSKQASAQNGSSDSSNNQESSSAS